MKQYPTFLPVEVDSYQASHFEMIPPGMENFQLSHAMFRKPLSPTDHRIVVAGLQSFVDLVLEDGFNYDEVTDAKYLFGRFAAGGQAHPFPAEMLRRVATEFGGRLPIVVQGVRDGTTVYPGEPVCQVWTDVPGMGELVGWIESSLLPYLFTMSTVATRGRHRKEMMRRVFGDCYPSASAEQIEEMIAYRFHDFGRRGAASSQLTGIAHLLNWLGTDTVDAVFAAETYLNFGWGFGACSIPAAAHRTVTPWPTEEDAYRRMAELYAGQPFSLVTDSYAFEAGTEKAIAICVGPVKERGGFLVVRPDSGDPIECVLFALRALAQSFETVTQELGLLEIQGAGVIQGDGVDDADIARIYEAVIEAGFSPSNVVFGMGENNHKAVRSEMELGYKTAAVEDVDGKIREVAKWSDSPFKRSIPGGVALCVGAEYRVQERDICEVKYGMTDDLVTLYDGRGPQWGATLVTTRTRFTEMRQLALESFDLLAPIPAHDTIDPVIRDKQMAFAPTTQNRAA